MNDIPQNVTTDDSTFRFWVVQTLTTLQVKLEGQIEDKQDQETRLRAVEKSAWNAAATSAAVASILTAIATAILTAVVRKYFA